MKVLQINNVHYRRGGADAVYLNTAELLLKHGDSVRFFNMKKNRNLPCVDDCFWVSSIESRKKGLISALKALRNLFYNPEAEDKIEELISVEKPDIAHVHLFYGMGISPSICKVLKKYHIPLVHTVHDYRMVCANSLFIDKKLHVCEKCEGRHFYKAIIEGCSHNGRGATFIKALEMYYHNKHFNPSQVIDGFIFVSKFAYEKHLEFMPELRDANSTVLYNFTKSEGNWKRKGGEDYFLYYGRLSYEKGIPTLLKVFARHPELKLNVVGTGPIQDELKKTYSRSNGGYKNIEFQGYKSGEELYDIVQGARFVCVPSEWYENNPMTIVEAYSMGTPVIGARIGGIPEIIDEGKTGYIFESGNPQDLEESILKANAMSQNDYDKMRETAFVFYKNHFSPETHYSKLIEFYKQTIEMYEQKK